MIRPTRCLLPLLGASLCTALLPTAAGADAAPAAAATAALQAPVIPRATLFGNPERTQARLSPEPDIPVDKACLRRALGEPLY